MNGKKTIKKMIKLIVLSMAVFGLLGLGTVQAGSLNMTGTWEGFTACDELKGGEFTHDSFPELLEISQDGDTVRMSGFGILYEGKVQEITGSSIQGEAVLGACGGIEETETVRIQRIITQGSGGGVHSMLPAYTKVTSSFPGFGPLVPVSGIIIVSRQTIPMSRLATATKIG